ncbi:MAG: DUF6691 family protein [Pseudomonadota bacterium]
MKGNISFLAGGLFGLGLLMSDMINPARVLAFLDVGSGAWDPTLAFVMGGAMVPMFVAWALRKALSKPLFSDGFPGVPHGVLTPGLIGGAALFGVGWGLVGLCPGPAFAGLLLGGWPVWLFVGAMLAGMLIHRLAPIESAAKRSV